MTGTQSDDTRTQINYRDTIFLPATVFPMRGGLPRLEPKLAEKWAENGLDAAIAEQGAGRTPFVLHDGPPYANGHIHIGHALNKISKDFINRAQRMSGKQVRYLPGWDCHGLPIEWKVEEENRKKGVQKESLPILEFRRQCRDYAAHWVKVQQDDFKRLGIQAEWDNRYVTMDYSSEALIAGEIGKFLLNGKLYRGLRPVMWSVVEKTALAEAEVEYKDVDSDTIFVAFPIKNDPTGGKLENASVVIWTTTPWTIPLNKALAFGPELAYGVYEIEEGTTGQGARLLLAQSLAEGVLNKIGAVKWRKIHDVAGSELAGATANHPFAFVADESLRNSEIYLSERPLLSGDFVSDEAGTGLVHMAPAHGEDDFRLCRANGIYSNVEVDDGGLYADHLGSLGGRHIFKTTDFICDLLTEAGQNRVGSGLLNRDKMRHSYPHSWRSGKPLIYRATPQWFISMDQDGDDKGSLRGNALEALKDVDFVPKRSRRRLETMIEGRPDWCISRQRSWGVPLPIFVHKETGEVLRDPKILKGVVEVFEKESADSWYAEGAKERFLAFGSQSYDPNAYEQVFDVVDVWFESGCSRVFVERDGLSFPADLYLEGSDQHRGWFQSSLLEAVGADGRAPYRAILTQGFVLDGKGRKMSKSLGNVIAPSKVVNDMGADLLRLWVATADSSEDLRVSDAILRQQSEIYRRLRNSLRWILGGLDGFTDQEILSYAELPELERYMLHQLAGLYENLASALKTHDWGGVYQSIYNFCNQELSAFYFDLRKDVLYCADPASKERRAVRTLLDILHRALTTWLAPVLVFTAEEAWQARFATEEKEWVESVHLQNLFVPRNEWADDRLEEKWTHLRRLRGSVTRALETARTDKLINTSLEATVKMPLSNDDRALMSEKDWEWFALISKAIFTPEGGAFEVEKADGEKCPRCWRVTEREIPNETDPQICVRCEEVVGREILS